MDFFSIVCGAASLLWLAAGALAVEDRWRQRRLTKKSEEALDRLLEEVFATAYDGWELDDYPQAEDVTVKWWMPIVESPEGVSGGMEHE